MDESEEMLFFFEITSPGGDESRKLATDGLEECELPPRDFPIDDHELSVDIFLR